MMAHEPNWAFLLNTARSFIFRLSMVVFTLQLYTERLQQRLCGLQSLKYSPADPLH